MIILEQQSELEALAKEQRKDGAICVFYKLEKCRHDWLGVYTNCTNNYLDCKLYGEHLREFVNR